MLTTFAFRFQRFVFSMAALLMAFGAWSYFTLPAQEDPAITIREAVVTTRYPGLGPERMEELVTKPLERAIRTLPEVEEIRSSTLAGTSIIHVEVADRFFALDQIWDDLRAEVGRAAAALPDGAGTPVVADDFGDVAVVTAALRSTDHGLAALGEMAGHVRDRLYAVGGTKSVEVLGLQPERVYVETRAGRLVSLGIGPDAIAAALASQNVIRPGGTIDLQGTALIVEPTGDYRDLDSIRETLIPAPDGGTVPLRDLASVRRTLVDPPPTAAYYQGRPAVVFAIAMQDGTNVLEYGPRVADALERIEAGLPLGYELDIVTFQADQVEAAVYGVTVNVLQTLAIVLVVVVLLLGLRTGLIVGSIVPVVTLATLAVMGMIGLPLERMSLATLVIALGVLVDNGIVVAEDFKRRLGEGEGRDEALAGAGRELALPLLSSTLTTILVFLPLMLAQHVAGEYTRSISIVMAITLAVSWLVAMTVTPALSHRFAKAPAQDAPRPLNERMFDPLKAGYGWLIGWMLRRRALVLVVTALALAGGVAGVATAPQSFFPSSDRPQLVVYLDLPADVTTKATDAAMNEVMPTITTERFDWLEDQALYVGFGGPRFVLSLTPVDPAPNRAVMVVNVDAPENVGRAQRELRAHLQGAFGSFQSRVTPMFLGPSDSAVLEVQVKGPDRDFVYAAAREVEAIVSAIPGARDIRQDWENRTARVRVAVDQARARAAGVTSADVARSLSAFYSGRPVSEFRDGDDVIPILARGDADERDGLDRIRTLPVFAASGAPVPLTQVAAVELVNGYSRIEREAMERTVTIQARSDEMGAEDMAPLIEARLDALRAAMPPGHTIELDGILVQSAEGRAALFANMPLCLAIIALLLVAQFNSLRRPLVILATVPLIVVGVAIGLRLFEAPFGFMPILGVLGLAGIILNNAIVLIDRIDAERAEGHDGDAAIVRAGIRRLRPIVMTTVTTVLGLLPLIVSRDPLFFGMAAVMASGLLVGTALTLGVVPVLYSLLMRTRRRTPEGGLEEAGVPAAAP